jgi:hypothetical protein
MKSSITIISLPFLLLACGVTASANMAPPRLDTPVPLTGENAKTLHQMLGGQEKVSYRIHVGCPVSTDVHDYKCNITKYDQDGKKSEIPLSGPAARILLNRLQTITGDAGETEYSSEAQAICEKNTRGESACEIELLVYSRRSPHR